MSNAKARIDGLKIAPIPPAGTSPTAIVEQDPKAITGHHMELSAPVVTGTLDDMLDLEEYEQEMNKGRLESYTLPSIIDF